MEFEDIRYKVEAEEIMRSIIEEIKCKEIIRIFTENSPVLTQNDNKDYIAGSLDTPVYIIFKRGKCLKIDFKFYSNLYIEYRELNKDEENMLSSNNFDLINGHYEGHSWDFDEKGNRIPQSEGIKQIYDIKGDYDKIIDFDIEGFNYSFEMWVRTYHNSTMIEIPAGGDYFKGLTLKMNNGLELTINPQPADADGYYDLYLKDTNKIISYSENPQVAIMLYNAKDSDIFFPRFFTNTKINIATIESAFKIDYEIK